MAEIGLLVRLAMASAPRVLPSRIPVAINYSNMKESP